MRKKAFYLFGLLAASVTLQSCFDKAYDLDDIDKTISTGADITLPSSSTGNILLKNIMEEGDIVKFIDDGNGKKIFAVVQDGNANIQQIDIPEIRISPTPYPIDATIEINPVGSTPAPRKKVQVVIGGIPVNIPDADFKYTIKEDDNASFAINKVTAQVDPVLRNIERASTKSPVKINLTLTASGLPSMLDKFYMDDFVISIPKGLEIASCEFMGNVIPAENITNGSIKLTNTTIAMQDGHNAEPITLAIVATGVKFGEDIKFEANSNPSLQGVVSLEGAFDVDGTFRISTADINSNELNTFLANEGASLASEIVAQQSLRPIFERTPINFRGNASVDPIVIGSMTGDIARALSDIEPIRLDNLPDFLNNPDVVLDLDNPLIMIHTRSNIPGNATTKLTLTSNFSGGGTAQVIAPTVQVPGTLSGTEMHFYLADKQVTVWPEGYPNANTTKLVHTGDKVKDLIYRIPEQVDVEVDSVRMYIQDMDITRPYNVDVKYEIFAPMIVGPDFKLVYSGTERGWAEDLDDIEDLDFGTIELKAKATSTLPAALTLSLIPLDRNARVIPELLINDVIINSNANGQEITFTLRPAAGHKLNDIIAGKNGVKQLDGLQYKAVIKSQTGGTFYDSGMIKLDDIKVTVKGGITYDAN